MSDRDLANQTCYQVNYGWNRRSVVMLIGCLAFVGAGFLIWDRGPVLAAVCIAFFGLGAVSTLITLVRGRLALRVNAAGITIGMPPNRTDVPGRTVPWADIEAVVLFEQVLPTVVPSTLSSVGVQRAAGLDPLPGSPGPRTLSASEVLIPGIARDVLATSVAVNGWRLDAEQLARTLEQIAPDVPLIDTRS